jgi:aspartate-semialdehyde dehydrogenase
MPLSPSIALIGATGAVGRECLSILEQRRFPHRSIRLLASARSAGTTIKFNNKPHPVEELGPNSFQDIDLAFFAAGADTAKAFAPIALEAGATVIDKSSAHRADPACPLVIPEINPELLTPHRLTVSSSHRVPSVLAVPNCSTIILMVPLDPLRRAFGVERILVSTYQAASGAGAAAMDELESQTRAVLGGAEPQPRIFKEPCAFNVFSHDSAVDPVTGANGEEAKMAAESRRIWNDPALPVHATCVRVPVLRGHSESITVTLRAPATEKQVRETLASSRSLTILDDRAANRFPTPLKASGGDQILVGRVRPVRDQSPARSPGSADDRCTTWSLFVSGDQLRIGAALTAVKIAELLLR